MNSLFDVLKFATWQYIIAAIVTVLLIIALSAFLFKRFDKSPLSAEEKKLIAEEKKISEQEAELEKAKRKDTNSTDEKGGK